MDDPVLQALADEFGGAISAHRFALESLFAMWLDVRGGAPITPARSGERCFGSSRNCRFGSTASIPSGCLP